MESSNVPPNLDPRLRATVSNFGGNVSFIPEQRYAPRTEEEVLQVLERHADSSIRVVGSLHSWSDCARSDQVLLDLRYLDQVEIEREADGQVSATVGAGCTIKRLLDVLRKEAGVTLPTVGVIKKQTIAGAVSTGTHGSGNPSLSHYLDEIRIAAYDPDSGQARIYCWSTGDELGAARCSLGCMGVILSVKFRCRAEYWVEESVVQRDSVEEVMAEQDDYPLQQFVLLPYSWKFFVYQRRVTESREGFWSSLLVRWARVEKLLLVDFFLHLLLKLLIFSPTARKGSSKFIRWWYGVALPPLIARNRRVVDTSEKALTLRHDLFRHLEMEVFVPSDNLPSAVEFIRQVVAYFAGESGDVPQNLSEQLGSIGELENFESLNGSYTHHYPIFFRHVHRDDTLISMTSGQQESYYSISFFTYLSPEARESFYAFAGFLARCLARLFQARLHWGKYFPLAFSDVQPQYPQLGAFRLICGQTDPKGVFQNDYTRRVLGFEEILGRE